MLVHVAPSCTHSPSPKTLRHTAYGTEAPTLPSLRSRAELSGQSTVALLLHQAENNPGGSLRRQLPLKELPCPTGPLDRLPLGVLTREAE